MAHILVVGMVMTEVGGAMLPASGRTAASAGLGGTQDLMIAEAHLVTSVSAVKSAAVSDSFAVEGQGAVRGESPSPDVALTEVTGTRHHRRQRKARTTREPTAPLAGRVAAAGSPPKEGPAALESLGAAGNGGGGVDVPPAVITSDNPAPEYPEEARLAHHEGRVRVRVAISGEGTVQEEAIIESSHFPELDRSALQAIRQWHFRPARRFGLPVTSSMIIPVVFRIEPE